MLCDPASHPAYLTVVLMLGAFGTCEKSTSRAIAMQPCRNHRITEQVMVGTHGQLKNLYSKRILKFQAVRIVVFDEADEMLKVGLPLSPSYQSAGSAKPTSHLGEDALAFIASLRNLLCCMLH